MTCPRLATRRLRASPPAASFPASAASLAFTVALGCALHAFERGLARGWWRRWAGGGYAPAVRWAVYYAAVVAIVFAGEWGNHTFIYARF